MSISVSDSDDRVSDRVLRANGGDPSTIDYWKVELAYWQNVRRDGLINSDTEVLARAKKAINLCTKHIGGMIRGKKAN